MLLISLASCSTIPSAKELSGSFHLHEQVIDSGKFKHRIFTNAAFASTQTGPLHVYIEGDGQPWILHSFIASDPTPYQPIVLPMLKKDSSPSIYLGRPCYFGLVDQDQRCNNEWWTSGRYSEEVVESMVIALKLLAGENRQVIWIGHSGGGTLASLLASRYKNTVGLITIAGNLNVGAWTHYHHYSDLNKSLDPSTLPILNGEIKQIHIGGEKDTNVLANWIKAYSDKQPNSRFWLKPETHTCCWDKSIAEALSQFQMPIRAK